MRFKNWKKPHEKFLSIKLTCTIMHYFLFISQLFIKKLQSSLLKVHYQSLFEILKQMTFYSFGGLVFIGYVSSLLEASKQIEKQSFCMYRSSDIVICH